MNRPHLLFFLRFSIVVTITFVLFIFIVVRALDNTAINYIKEKLVVAANQIDAQNPLSQQISELQSSVKVFPLFVAIRRNGDGFYLFNNEMYPIKATTPGFTQETYMGNKFLIYVTYKEGNMVRVSTLISNQMEKVQVAKIFTIIFGIILYFATLVIGYIFILSLSRQIEEHIRRLRMFNSNISHELRTPLTVINSEVELGLEETKDKNCKRILTEIQEEIRHIDEITERLLFITRQEDIDPRNFQEVDLEEMVLELFEKYNSRIAIDLDTGIGELEGEDEEEGHNFTIIGDKALIKIALSNLIENSIKYGATKITLVLRKGPEGIELKEIDNGQGIPPDKIPYLFDEFYRVDSARNRKIKGFGLGLSIVKTIIQLHQADIKIESEGQNKGTTFTIIFPYPDQITKKKSIWKKLKKVIYG
jgi:signal transduction histidine kinase